MMNNRDNIANDNTTAYIFIGLFSVLIFIAIICFCMFKGKKIFKNKYTDVLCNRLRRDY